jgi:hypothetical protein
MPGKRDRRLTTENWAGCLITTVKRVRPVCAWDLYVARSKLLSILEAYFGLQHGKLGRMLEPKGDITVLKERYYLEFGVLSGRWSNDVDDGDYILHYLIDYL